MEGNQRWVNGQLEHPHQSAERRHEVAAHQDPLALVFSCIDSRVPPEIVFDCGVGDLFVFRTGAEAMDNQVVLGSVEFGPNGYESSRLSAPPMSTAEPDLHYTSSTRPLSRCECQYRAGKIVLCPPGLDSDLRPRTILPLLRSILVKIVYRLDLHLL